MHEYGQSPQEDAIASAPDGVGQAIREETGLRILLVEDSEDDALLIAHALRRGGLPAETIRVQSAAELEAAMLAGGWDLVITDHWLPDITSADTLAAVRASALDVPVIIVSGNIGEEAAVAAMKAGAHDYVMKDNLRRLVPVIQREMREADRRRSHRRTQDSIRYLASHDSLTGLINRSEFGRRLREALATSQARGLVHAVLYLDLDRFKRVNDSCGHAAGDELLVQLAQVLQAQVRESDALARLGGDEFGVLLESCHLDDAREIAGKLLIAVRGFRFVWSDQTFSVGASIGLTMVSPASTDPDEVLMAADMACYAAKDRGRDRVQVYDEDDVELERRRGEARWVSHIGQALEENRLVLFKQAVVPLDDRGGVHWELLLRMRTPEGRIVAPGAFLPAAERHGLMPTIDRWVIDTALAHAAGQRTPGSLWFIKVSGDSLDDGELAGDILAMARRHGVTPAEVCFEINEAAAISRFAHALALLRGLQASGFQCALDHFGSGLSSFSYLKSLPTNYLKIDGGLVNRLADSPMDRAIVEAIVHIARVARMRTIAEQVETEAVRQRLGALGIDFAQGYAIAKPRPLE